MTLKKITPDKPSKVESIGSREYYPSFHLKVKDIPEAKKWDVGKNYRLEMEVEMKSIEETEKRQEVGFDVKAVGVIKGNPKKDYNKMVNEGK